MAKYIFLDTNNWIYLSNGFNPYSNEHDELHLKIFDNIQYRVQEGSLVFLINDIVIEEWNRNREITKTYLKKIENKYKSYNDALKEINDFISDEVKEIDSVRQILEEKYQEKVKRLEEHINSVEHFLLNQTVKIEVSDGNKIEASNLALSKKAPFIGDKKNSMADALILLSAIEHIQKNEKRLFTLLPNDYYYPESFFVSSNKSDFSSPKDKELIHPDLEPVLNRVKTKYFFALSKLIDSLEEEFLTKEEAELIEHADELLYCNVCDYEHGPTVDFSSYFDIPIHTHEFIDPNQLRIDFSNFDYNDKEVEVKIADKVRIRKADCYHCGAEFIECVCEELVHIDEYNVKLECQNCGNKYIVLAEIDRKGMVYDKSYEFFKEYTCQTCGRRVDAIDETGNCEECAEYERLYVDR